MNLQVSTRTCVGFLVFQIMVWTGILWFHSRYEFAVSPLPSLPYRYYLIQKGVAIRPEAGKPTYISFRHPGYAHDLIKVIQGQSGDIVSVQGNTVYINDRACGVIAPKDSQGKELQPIHEQRIPEDYYFVMGTHPHSFDSRYADFGLVHLSQIRGQAWPIA